VKADKPALLKLRAEIRELKKANHALVMRLNKQSMVKADSDIHLKEEILRLVELLVRG
jgi:hypothetical protein